MANQVEIANIALSQVKAHAIESFDESSTEAEVVNRIYSIARDACLSDVAPRWARKQSLLSELTEEVSGWDYVYSYPADCLEAIEIYNSAKVNDEDKIPFEIASASSGNASIILTDEAEAELIYTAKITNTGVYDFLFVEALIWKLSSYLAIPLKGDDRLQASCAKAYSAAVGIAKAKTKNEGWRMPDSSSSFVRAR